MNRRLTEGSFWLGVALGVLGLVLGAELPKVGQEQTLEAGNFVTALCGSFSSRVLVFLVPIASVLPCGDTYLRERQQGFVKLMLVRGSRRQYTAEKVWEATAGGLLVWFIAGGMALFFSFLVLFPLEQRGTISLEAFFPFFLGLLRVGLIGSVLSHISAFIGALSESFYLTFGLPFVGYYLLVILRERYLDFLYTADPKVWVEGTGFWGGSQAGLFLFLLLLLLVAMTAHGAMLHYRLVTLEE